MWPIKKALFKDGYEELFATSRSYFSQKYMKLSQGKENMLQPQWSQGLCPWKNTDLRVFRERQNLTVLNIFRDIKMSWRDKGRKGRTPKQSKILSKEIDIINQLSRSWGWKVQSGKMTRWQKCLPYKFNKLTSNPRIHMR